MDFNDSAPEAAFRSEVRAFIRDECPPGIRRRGFGAMFGGGGWDDIRMGTDEYRTLNANWAKKLADKGWIAPAWPKEYGGAGMTVMQQFIFNQEMASAGAPKGGNYGIGTGWAGPTIILYGTEEQKQKYLPPIVRGEVDLVPGLQRARRRLRPGVAADARDEGRRRLRRQRPEDLDLRRARRQLHDPARAHGPRRAEAQGHQLLHRRHEVAGHRSPAARQHGRTTTTSTKSSSTTCACRRRTCSAKRTAAGTSARRRSTSSAPASRRASRTD